MSFRGRGTLEIRPSANPFFQTTSSDIGLTAADAVEWSAPESIPVVPGTVNLDSTSSGSGSHNFSFLYARTSDVIGGKVAPPETPAVIRPPTKAEFLRERYSKRAVVTGAEICGETQAKPSPADLLKLYTHQPKREDPRYTTSGNEIGRQEPTLATFVAER